MTTTTFFIISVILTAVLVLETQSFYLPKRSSFRVKSPITDPKKRPFCNAFTGCGRKRSNIPALTHEGDVIDDSISSLLELNDPATEDLSRQIMSKAKEWENIQEIKVELDRRRQQESAEGSNEDAAVVPSKNAAAFCALPPCYI